MASLTDCFAAQNVKLSLPSLRIDSFSPELAARFQGERKGGLTFAPEAGTERLRRVINKNLTDEQIMQTTEAAFAAGWQRLKLYFMIGLPTETDADLQGIGGTGARNFGCWSPVARTKSWPGTGDGECLNLCAQTPYTLSVASPAFPGGNKTPPRLLTRTLGRTGVAVLLA